MGNDNAQQRLIKVFEYLRFNNLITTQLNLQTLSVFGHNI